LDANGPIAPQMSALRRAFRLEKRDSVTRALRRTNTDPRRPKPQTLISARNLLGCHGISSVKCGLGRPPTGSALHHLVTAVSVKKALKGRLQFPRRRVALTTVIPGHASARTRNLEIPRRAIARLRSGPPDHPGMTGQSGDASRTHSDKMRSDGRLLHCADDIVKE
jgi:hypothetical protein